MHIPLLPFLSLVLLAVSVTAQIESLSVKAETAFRGQHWPEAEQLYRQLVESKPEYAEAWRRLGHSLHAQQKYGQAVIAHQKAAGFPTVAADAAYHAACAHALLGDGDQALHWLEKAVKNGFDNANGMQADPDLASLRDDQRFGKLLRKLGATLRKYDAATNQTRPSSKQFAALPQASAFDFMGAEWKIKNTFISARGRIQTDGSNHGAPLLGGKVIIDHYTGTLWNRAKLAGITIRAYDQASDTWSLVWLDDRQTPRFSPMVGKFVDGVGVFYRKGKTEKTAATRFHWDGIDETHARWMQQVKTVTDQGAKWMATWVMEFSRD